ncbi:efflux RND transporter periplasmic adaptor subunit [Aestuariibaculum lutulentum]|uniref:Efflux RND transporter periplasmic adaptor subunit n=1 Tax=Aestuariibaculum lutulentum TaxID=2920935 RepID=A0ABS9RH81_9FLAO|nr:efflux RND transporter periplasmic adaptor subunit [Aestuariibaculum lutulentum]MCH4551876.1 efflux RND transporter periplasmic adaptor subunit [Aestuariibaculum lutulentum]
MKNLYILIALFTVMACKNSEKNTNSVTEEVLEEHLTVTQKQFETENMKLGKLEQHTFNNTINVSGIIDVPPHNKATISSFMGGYITKTPLLIGDQVKKGQLLVSMENPEFIELQQQYLEISEQLNYLKSEYTRQKSLFDENITSQKNFLKAESTYKSALAEYNGLKKKLSMLNISPASVEQGQLTSTVNLYSPINGYITKVEVSNGIYVSPSDMIMEIIDTDHIHLELSVFEKDILNIKKGQKINFKIPEASKQTFEAEVHLVGTTVDEKNRVIKVHAHILNEEQANFIVGMFVEASIISESVEKSALPKDALIEYEDAIYVLVLEHEENGTYSFKKVKLNIGLENETYAEILNHEDLMNKTILTQGGFMLLAEEGGGHSH